MSFARKVLKLLRGPERKGIFLTQRRNGAKKTLGNAVALCAFAPLREKSIQVLFGQSRLQA
jgi:hypothetical protein